MALKRLRGPSYRNDTLELTETQQNLLDNENELQKKMKKLEQNQFN